MSKKAKKHHHHAKDEPAVKLSGMKDLRDYQISLSDYISKGELGQGGSGRVWKGQSKLTGWMVAIKELLPEKLTEKEMEIYKREIRIMAQCNDQFLLDFIGFTATPPYSIVMPYMPSGSLWDYLHNNKGNGLNATQKTNIAMGIAHGMKYLHAHRIIHRDLKSPNILLDERLLPKVADFGLGRFVTDCEAVQKMTQNMGTPIWMAPELIENGPYNAAVDVYAYGMILYEMLTEKVPWEGQNQMQIFAAISTKDKRPEIPPELDGNSMSNLIRQCWDRDPQRRPTFEEIYTKFANSSVMFPQTEPRGTAVLIHEIEQQERIVQSAVKAAADNLNQILEMRRQPMEIQNVQNLLTQRAREGNVVEITKILAAYLQNADINGRDSSGVTPLHAAIAAKQLLVVQYIMRIKVADKNIRDQNDNTPLMAAVLSNNQRIVTYLVQCNGVDINLQNDRGMTALHCAATLTSRDAQIAMVNALCLANQAIDTSICDSQGHKAFARDREIMNIIEKAEKEKAKRRGK